MECPAPFCHSFGDNFVHDASLMQNLAGVGCIGIQLEINFVPCNEFMVKGPASLGEEVAVTADLGIWEQVGRQLGLRHYHAKALICSCA